MEEEPMYELEAKRSGEESCPLVIERPLVRDRKFAVRPPANVEVAVEVAKIVPKLGDEVPTRFPCASNEATEFLLAPVIVIELSNIADEEA